jgi:hypothetical protein
VGYAKEERKEIRACSKAWFGVMLVHIKKKRYPTSFKERESNTKGVHTWKPHACTFLIRLHDLFLLGSRLWLSNMSKASMSLYSSPELYISLTRW